VTAVTLACAYAGDLLFGDPEWLPHPVRVIGRITIGGQAVLRPGHRSARQDLLSGAGLCGSVVTLTAVAAVVILASARRLHPAVGFVTETLLASTTLATGSLLAEARQVINALDRHDLARARRRLARIVGRDTNGLPAPEVARGVIETLAESTCDGIVAPLCYLAVGGVPAALAYKAVSTLDSMIGHREPPYTFFGRCAARLDDVANFIPARLTASMIVIAAAVTGSSGRGALRVWWHDHGHHDSPNAGHPEAAMAGALGVTLGGVNIYDGVPHEKPLLAAGEGPATPGAARRACRIVLVASMMSGALALIVRLIVGGAGRR
jgi:adenosylcobinamide-phosphate synthase